MNPSPKASVEHYVNFKRAVGYFRRCLISIHNGQPVKHVIEWNGGPGLGKTSLINKVMKENCNKNHMSWTLINFKSSIRERKNYYNDPTLLIWDLTTGLLTNQNRNISSLELAIEAYRNVRPSGDFIENLLNLPRNDLTEDWVDAMNRVCSTFIEIVEKIGRRRGQIQPVVFFLDETESVDHELLDWFEEALLSRLVLKEYCLVVWTGRRHWRWKRPEVRNQLVREDLGHFEPDDVEDFINLNHTEKAKILLGWVDAVHRLSAGHGYSVALAVHVLDKWLEDHPDEKLPASYEAMECELLSTLRQDFVWDYAFEDLDTNTSKALESLALLRSIDTNLVMHIVLQRQQSQFGDPYDEAHDLLDRLQKTDLLTWKNTSYAVGEDIRHVLYAYYRKCEPDSYIEVHEQAVKAYSEMLLRAGENLNLLTIEKLYHMAALSQLRNGIDLEKEFSQHLNEYLIRIKDETFRLHTLEQLQFMLKNDIELRDLTDNLSIRIFARQVQDLIERLSNQ
jgi:hypothetical protein